MRFAKVWFTIAGWWGIVTLTPLLFLYDAVGRMNPPAATHPEFYYGFITVGLAWQVGFLILGRDPGRLRPMMVPAILEKLGYVACCAVLYAQGRISASSALTGISDLVLATGFIVAYLRCPDAPCADR